MNWDFVTAQNGTNNPTTNPFHPSSKEWMCLLSNCVHQRHFRNGTILLLIRYGKYKKTILLGKNMSFFAFNTESISLILQKFCKYTYGTLMEAVVMWWGRKSVSYSHPFFPVSVAWNSQHKFMFNLLHVYLLYVCDAGLYIYVFMTSYHSFSCYDKENPFSILL